MTEPESEAESMSSDDDDGIEFKVYYQDKDCIDIMIPSMKVKCKGCQKKFPFSKDAGVKMSDSPMVKSFYEHCSPSMSTFHYLRSVLASITCEYLRLQCVSMYQKSFLPFLSSISHLFHSFLPFLATQEKCDHVNHAGYTSWTRKVSIITN